MRKAYHSWQKLNARLEAAWKELNLQYLALFDKAQTCRIDTSQGLLRLASSVLSQPFDIKTLQLREGLTQAFKFLGKSFCRRSPTSLQLDLYRYADCIEKICLQFKRLSAKLRLAQEVLDLLEQNKNVSRDYCNKTLFNPEAVWTTLLLQQRYRLSQKNYKLSLNHSWQAKLTACKSWLKLLQTSLPPENLLEFRQILHDMEALNADPTASGPQSQDPFLQCDLCAEIAHRLSAPANFPPSDKNKV